MTLRDVYVGGAPLLRSPLTVSQASSADGCITQLYRLGHSGAAAAAAAAAQSAGGAAGPAVVVSGWLDLGGSGEGGEGGESAFGVGEMASVVLTLGQFSAS